MRDFGPLQPIVVPSPPKGELIMQAAEVFLPIEADHCDSAQHRLDLRVWDFIKLGVFFLVLGIQMLPSAPVDRPWLFLLVLLEQSAEYLAVILVVLKTTKN